MPEITPAQVHNLLVGAHEYMASSKQTGQARDQLGRLLLDTARQAKASLRDLSAASGLHHATVRALIARAAGRSLPDGWTQPELALPAKPGHAASAARTRASGASVSAALATPTQRRPPISM